MAGITIRDATRGDIGPLATTFASAFFDDPPFVWALPQSATRQRRLRRMFGTILRVEAPAHGVLEVACDGYSIVGGALWLAPNHWKPSASRQLLALPAFVRAFGRRFGYLQAMATAAARSHPREPHWYLHVIGVDPGYQGRGVGGALLRSQLQRCDQDSQPAYLESSKTANVPLYQHFGFQPAGELALPRASPTIITMWRPASPEAMPDE